LPPAGGKLNQIVFCRDLRHFAPRTARNQVRSVAQDDLRVRSDTLQRAKR